MADIQRPVAGGTARIDIHDDQNVLDRAGRFGVTTCSTHCTQLEMLVSTWCAPTCMNTLAPASRARSG